MELAFTPHGRVVVGLEPAESEAETFPQLRKIAKAFSAGMAEGLFTLAAQHFDCPLGPSVAYWREYASRYLTELCHTPEGAAAEVAAIPPPDEADLDALLHAAPPMQGAEYLGRDAVVGVWQELDAWARAEIANEPEHLAGFLNRRAPLWRQVGRVCFHLAENRRDENFPFAFLATYASGLTAGNKLQYLPLSRALRESAAVNDRKALRRLLWPVYEASKKSEFVKHLLDSGDLYAPLAWTPREAYRFLKEAAVLEESGVIVRLPDWWKKRPRPRVGVTIGQKRKGSFGADEMLDFRVERALGDQTLTEEEWESLMAAEDGLVFLRGQWVEVDREKLQEALDHWKQVESHAGEGMSFVEGMRLLAGAPADLADDRSDGDRQWSFVRAGQWLGDLLAKMRSPETNQLVCPEFDVHGTLRKYQETGVQWLWFLANLGLGACLADDMGLGKTIQLLALFSALKKQGSKKPSLLVLPASLLANWQAEMQRFTPGLRAKFVHPSLCKDGPTGAESIAGADVVATTYGMLLRQEWLRQVPWKLVVLDEAQAIKNPEARQTKAVKQLKAEARIALTGTPVENRLSDLWSLFDFLSPGLLGNASRFKQFVKTLEKRQQNRYAPLRNLVQPYILRRLKTDRRIIDDLPDKTEIRAYCGLSKRQAALYAKLVDELAQALRGLDGIKRRGLVLAYLMRFKQLCNHPSQLTGEGDFAADESGKFARLGEICEEIASRQEKALVFTQFREMTEPLAAYLARLFGRPGLVLSGSTAVNRRKGLVDQFQRDDGPPFFILSLKAGGTGLNLTAASHVIHFDRWWNPAVENQATDRAFRIGQKRNVLVHKFVCRGTIEEKIDALIEEKTQLASDLLEGGAEKLLTEMNDAELLRFVSLDVDAATGEAG